MRALIPFSKPDIGLSEKKLMSAALDSTWISGGNYISDFEGELSKFLGTPNVLVVNNGTSAIHLAFLAIGIKPGDEVILPGFGYMAAANVLIQLGGIPRFADVEFNSFCLDPASVSLLIGPRTRAIVAIHSYGNVCDLEKLMSLSESNGIFLIEDAAESFGSLYRGRASGTIGHIGTFSFHATKTITTGEGGCVVTARSDLHESMGILRSHGVNPVKKYFHEVPGHNFRLTNIQAALGLAQIGRIEEFGKKRKKIFAKYYSTLISETGLSLQQYNEEVDSLPWAFALRLQHNNFKTSRDQVIEKLLAEGIEARNGFYAASELPYLDSLDPIPNSLVLSKEVLVLPIYPAMTEDDVLHICSKLIELR